MTESGKANVSRRDFLRVAAITAGAAVVGGVDVFPANAFESGEMPKRQLGNMGFNASILGLGGAPIAGIPNDDAVAILDRCFELGMNYFDTAAQYGDGESERKYGLWLQKIQSEGKRADVFVATKTLTRRYDDASREIERSWGNLNTEYIDLLQVHSITGLDVWREVNSENGAFRAIKAAKEDGRVRHLGITGHVHPDFLRAALEDYPFDSVLFPLGVEDRIFAPHFHRDLLPELVEKGISVVAMKVYAEGKLIAAGGDKERSLHYTMSLPISTMIVGMNRVEQVDENVGYVYSYTGMSEEEIIQLTRDSRNLLKAREIWWKN